MTSRTLREFSNCSEPFFLIAWICCGGMKGNSCMS